MKLGPLPPPPPPDEGALVVAGGFSVVGFGSGAGVGEGLGGLGVVAGSWGCSFVVVGCAFVVCSASFVGEGAALAIGADEEVGRALQRLPSALLRMVREGMSAVWADAARCASARWWWLRGTWGVVSADADATRERRRTKDLKDMAARERIGQCKGQEVASFI